MGRSVYPRVSGTLHARNLGGRALCSGSIESVVKCSGEWANRRAFGFEYRRMRHNCTCRDREQQVKVRVSEIDSPWSHIEYDIHMSAEGGQSGSVPG